MRTSPLCYLLHHLLHHSTNITRINRILPTYRLHYSSTQQFTLPITVGRPTILSTVSETRIIKRPLQLIAPLHRASTWRIYRHHRPRYIRQFRCHLPPPPSGKKRTVVALTVLRLPPLDRRRMAAVPTVRRSSMWSINRILSHSTSQGYVSYRESNKARALVN